MQTDPCITIKISFFTLDYRKLNFVFEDTVKNISCYLKN